jgi:hypothetical protein
MSIEKIVAGLAGRVDLNTAAELLRRGLTLEGRIEWEDAIAPLSAAERHACDRIAAHEHPASLFAGNFSLAFRPRGRLYLLPREEFETHVEALTLLCHVELDTSDLQSYHAQRQSSRQALEHERAEICAELKERGFESVCTGLASVAEHMAPLLYYVEECCISNFYDIGKSGFALEMTLSHALQQVAERREQADIESLTAVYCLHLVLGSGSYTRLEELNSTQLSRRAVADFLDRKCSFYEQDCGCPAETNFSSASLWEKAATLARMREAIAGRQRFIRLISGLNLRKREAILPLPAASTCDTLAPCTSGLPSGSPVRKLLSPEHFERLLGTELIPKDHLSSFGSSLEYLLDRVVAEAVHSTNSDFGMTRSARDYRRFAEVLHGRQTAVACGWSQAEYFCHVVPSQAALKTFSTKSLFMTLNAISARMRYNTWHYVPSYFDVADVPADRGWFTAPRMADIADDSDQHHNGHVHATVRYSIRSPLPLRVGREVLPGFIDLRLMRQSGNPYNQEDLVTAIAYTEALQFLYQCLMNHVLEHNVGFTFSFGDKNWFERVYPARTAPPPIVQPVSQPQSVPAA